MTNLQEFTAACIEALYFADTGDDESQPDSDAPLAEETRLDLEADCRSFWRRYGCFVNVAECTRGDGRYSKASQAGHDFWLTRQGHGAGFWDGAWSKPHSETLDKGAESFGSFDIYQGDDGKIYTP